MSGKITILGVGGAGCRILRRLAAVQKQFPDLRLLAVDTDERSLAETGLPAENRLLAGSNWRNGRGCSGNEIDGQRAMAKERPELERLLAGSDMLMVLGGLGRGTATGGMMVLPSLVAKLKIPAVFLLTLPFSMEGHTIRRRAEQVLNDDVFPVAEAVAVIPNDLLFSTLEASTSLEKAFELADTEMARTALALSQVVLAGNVLNSSFDDLTAVFKRKKNVCGIGIGTAAADGDPSAVVEQLFYSPLLGGPARLADADAVVLSLLGGPELSLGTAKGILDTAGRQLGENAQILVAAASSPQWAGQLQLTALAVKFQEEEAAPRTTARKPHPAADRRTQPNTDMTQLTFSFTEMDKGIMVGTIPVFWESEDLDFPTFQRRNAVIDNGRQ